MVQITKTLFRRLLSFLNATQREERADLDEAAELMDELLDIEEREEIERN